MPVSSSFDREVCQVFYLLAVDLNVALSRHAGVVPVRELSGNDLTNGDSGKSRQEGQTNFNFFKALDFVEDHGDGYLEDVVDAGRGSDHAQDSGRIRVVEHTERGERAQRSPGFR